MKCIKRAIFAPIWVMVGLVSSMGRAEVPPTLAQIQAKYQKAGTLHATFEQSNQNAATGVVARSQGQIYVALPHKIRWETQSPQANLLVGNGQKFWLYTPPFDPTDPTEHGQVMERRADQVQSEFASVLLSGAFSGAVSRIKPIDATHFTLIPKPGSAGTVKEADLTIDPKLLLITDVTLRHAGGNTSLIHLSQIELGPKFRTDLFEFHPPPNTDRIEN